MPRRFALALLMSAVGMVSALVATQQPPPVAQSAGAVRLRAATFSPARGEAPLVAAAASGASVVPGQLSEYLVQFEGPVLDAWKGALVDAGATLLEYVPDFTFRVRLRPEGAARVRALPFVAWVGPYLPAYKLPAAQGTGQDRPYIVRLDRDADVIAVEASLGSAGVRVARTSSSLVTIIARAEQLGSLAQVTGVASIEPFALRVKHNEFGGGVILGSQIANTNGYDGSTQIMAVADTGVGTGTLIGAHADLPASRVRAIFNRPGVPDFCFDAILDDGARDVDSGHGTHVATAALGSGNARGVGRGTAPAATLVFQALENYAVPSLVCSLLYGVPEGYYLVGLPGDLGELYQQAHDEGARVHSDSWGSAVAGAYTADAENTDAFVWTHRDMAIVFSAGNEGADADGDGRVDPGSIGSPATAKNVISVGASENDRRADWECDPNLSYTACAAQGGQNTLFTYGGTWPDSFPANPLRDDVSAGNAEQMAAFSSRGPTSDGRIKPDVVAPGTWTLSGYAELYQQQYDGAPNPQNGSYQYDGWGIPADASYKYMGGTSMAAPLAAGGAAVVRDFYQKARAHQASAALVKATLINSAIDLLDENNDGILDNAVPIPNVHEGWGRVDLANATDNTQQFLDEAAPLSTGATATFTFPVAEAGSPFKATLVWTDYPASPTAAVNLVNDLDLTLVAPDGTIFLGNVFGGGWSVTGGSPDRVNNVENAYVPSAAPGTWTIVVSGYNVPMGPQRFALVVDNGPVGNGLPVVRVSIDDGSATEAGPTGGVFRVTRTGDPSAALTVLYIVSGTAAPGSDYVALAHQVTIPEGSSDVIVPIEPLDDDLVESTETVTLTLAANEAYTVGSPATGTVVLTSDDLPPDLTVTSLGAPSTAAAGASMNLTDTTRNQATAGAPASETGFYLSPNATLDAADAFLGRRVVSALPAGGSEQATTSVMVPESAAAGTYYVIAKADWANQLEETSNANNTRASGVVRIGPDLVVTTASVPSTAAPGSMVSVTDTTKNQGAGAAPETVTRFYLSTNTSWDASDVLLGGRPVAALASGAVESTTTMLTIPGSTEPGSYSILVVADAENAVPEATETNNLRSALVRVGADLAVTAMTAPAAVAIGADITVSETTKNSGGAETSASTTEYFLSSNTSLDPADMRIGSRPVPGLAAGASSSATGPLSVPADTAAGTYYLLAKADALGEIDETSESNNVRASGAMKVGPDLTVVSLTAPSTAEAGSSVNLADSVKNVGGAPSAATETVFYLSTNSTVGGGDIELGRRAVPGLAISATNLDTVTLVLPAATATGSYYVLAVVDPGNVVAEALESNNVKASGLLRIGPDLLVPALTGPGSAIRGTSIAVGDTTRNQGGGSAAPSTTRFYLSTNASFDAGDIALGGRSVGSLAPGASSVASTALVIPSGTAPGAYYLVARVDDGLAVVETSETNNTRAVPLRVDP